MGVFDEAEAKHPDFQYFCERCQPDRHPELLEYVTRLFIEIAPSNLLPDAKSPSGRDNPPPPLMHPRDPPPTPRARGLRRNPSCRNRPNVGTR